MKRILCICFALLSGASVFGQGRTEAAHSATIYPLGLEYGYEIPLSSRWTVRPHAGVDALLGWNSSMLIVKDEGLTFDDSWYYLVQAMGGVDFRYYYNLSRRMEQGRPTGRNSGNFFGIDLQYYSPSFIEYRAASDGYVQFVPRWGMRRVYREKWLLEVDLGVKIATNGDDWGWAPRLGVKWGFVF